MKTSIIIDCPIDLYEEVVKPKKQKREFSKLILELLEAYRSNDSINGYINGSLDEMEEEGLSYLEKACNDQLSLLSSMGIGGEMAKAELERGMEEISAISSGEGVAEKAKDNSGGSVTREDVVEIVSSSIADLKDSLMEMLKGVNTLDPVGTKNGDLEDVDPDFSLDNIAEGLSILEDEDDAVLEDSTEGDLSILEDEDDVVLEDSIVEEVFDEEVSEDYSEDSSEAQDALDSLFGSIQF